MNVLHPCESWKCSQNLSQLAPPPVAPSVEFASGSIYTTVRHRTNTHLSRCDRGTVLEAREVICGVRIGRALAGTRSRWQLTNSLRCAPCAIRATPLSYTASIANNSIPSPRILLDICLSASLARLFACCRCCRCPGARENSGDNGKGVCEQSVSLLRASRSPGTLFGHLCIGISVYWEQVCSCLLYM